MTDKLSRPMAAIALKSKWEDFVPEPQRAWMKTYFKMPSNKPMNTLVAIMDEQDGVFTHRLYMKGECRPYLQVTGLSPEHTRTFPSEHANCPPCS